MNDITYFCAYMVMDMGKIKSYGDFSFTTKYPLEGDFMSDVKVEIAKSLGDKFVGKIILTALNRM